MINLGKKHIYVTHLLLLITLFISCQTKSVKNDAIIHFAKSEIDMSKLAYKKEAACEFELMNSGKSPLVIVDIQTSCGCTVPEWTHRPIAPGKKEKIKIKYDTSHPGRFRKTITVYYNGPKSPKELVVKGEVEFPEDI